MNSTHAEASTIASHTLPKLCIVCSLPGSPCTACENAPGYGTYPGGTVYYCGKECQDKDKENHKELCERRSIRKRFARAASILSHAWEAYRAAAYHWKVYGTCQLANELFLFLDPAAEMHRSVMRPPYPLLTGLNDTDRASMLNVSMCTTVVGDMHYLLFHMLRGEEMVQPHNSRL